MSKTIDERVVEMRFDNKQFESGVATTMSTLDKLKQSLNLTGAAKGLEDVNAAAKRFDMSGMGGAIDTVRTKFSALEIMAVTTLANITNSAVNAGKKIIAALTIDPIKTGFQEYETKINAIQTIMSNTANKGTTMEDVTRVLDELNTYADKTIYNFAEMTRNIGTFTAAGVGLEDAASAIQGIANLAAASGSSSQQASTAMYQLSQALATGTVKLMDWNSVVNAGMGGQKFQEALKQTAREYGVNVDAIIEKNGSFRDSLQEGWLSADILNTTLQKFTVEGAKQYAQSMMDSGKWTQKQADALLKEAQAMEDAATKVKTFTQLWDTLKESAQSGWSQSWEIIIGNFEEAKEFLTEISDTIGGLLEESANARNKVLQGWKDLGGRTALIDALRNSFEAVMNVITPVKEAFREIFPPITAEQLFAFTEGLRNLTEHLKLSENASNNLKRTFKGLFAILDIVKQAFSAIFKAIIPLFGGFDNLGGGILEVTGSIGDWLVKLDETIKKTDIFNKAVQGIVGFVKNAASAVKDFIDRIQEKFGFSGFEVFHAFLERVHERMSQVGDAAIGMKSAVTVAIEALGAALENSKFLQMLQALWNGVKTIGEGLVKAFGALTEGIVEKISNANFSGLMDLINTAALGGIALAISKFLKSFSDTLDDLGSIKDSVINILDSIRGCFEAYQTQLKANTLLKIAGAIAILAAAIVAISLIDSNKLSGAIAAITMLFADLMGSMAIFNKISGDLTRVVKACGAMITISTAVLILASALKKLGSLDFGEMMTGLVGVVALTGTMIAAAKMMSGEGKTIMKGATQMVILAAAIKILASACEDLSALNWEELAKGLIGVGVLLGELSLFLNTAKFIGKAVSTAAGIIILSAAMKILASACKDFGQMNWEEIAKGLVSIGGLLLEITAFTKLTGNAQNIISTSIALIAMGAAMKIFASAIQDMSNMSWEELTRGLTGMAGALLAITAALRFMPTNIISIGVGLIAVSAAIVILSEALNKLGNMKWEEIAKSLVALGGSMLILAVSLNAMTGTLAGSAALLVAAGALAILTPVLSILGAMSWESIAKGLITIAGAFTILGVAGAVLGPLVPSILGLAGALALVGAAILAAGVGLMTAGAGISALAVGFTALATAVAGGATAIAAGLTIIISGIASLIPMIIQKIGEGIVAFYGVIADAAPALGEAFKAIVLSLVDVLVECIPAIANGALELVAGVLSALVEYTPQIVDSIFQFLIGVLEGVAKNLPNLIQATVDVFMAYFSGIVDALKGIDTDTLIKGIAGIGLLSAIMLALAALAALVPAAMAGVLGFGLVVAELTLVLAAVGALAQIPGLDWLINEGGKLLEDIGVAIGSFVGGIVGGFMGGVSSQFPKIGSDLADFMKNVQPFIDGAKNIDESAMNGVQALADAILVLTAANVLEGLTSWLTGGSSMSAFGEELAKFGPYFNSYYQSIKDVDGSVVTASANAALALAKMAAALPNSGGIAGWFMGENSLSVFADELAEFGPKLKTYADSVAGLDANVVTNSANAAMAIAEMASNLPNQGGVTGWFMGENSLSIFADELTKFGPKLKAYADSVVGLDANVVTNSTNAAMAVAEMASNLPNQGGAVSWFTGDNTLSVFGDELAKFGPKLKAYADSLAGLDPNIVVNSANAAKILAEMASILPNSGGAVSWFTGDNTLSAFGDELAAFGPKLKAYADSVSGINAASLSGVISQTNELVSMIKGMSGFDSSGASSFAAALENLGKAGVDGFINVFTNAGLRAKEAANSMVKAFTDAANNSKSNISTTFTSLVDNALKSINSKQAQFGDVGQKLMTGFVTAVETSSIKFSTILAQMLTMALTKIRSKQKEFYSAGQILVSKLIEGAKSKITSFSSVFTTALDSALTSIRNKYGSFYSAGSYLVDGFMAGISANTFAAEAAASAMAESALNAAKDALGIHSPSRKFAEIGLYAIRGLVEGLNKNCNKVSDSAEDVGKTTLNSLKETISRIKDFVNESVDVQPTIRPVVDMSDAESKVQKLNNMFSRAQAMSISSSMNYKTNEQIQNGEKESSDNGNTYNFTQNNYSPKALSRLEIYRQTKNQFSALKGTVKV